MLEMIDMALLWGTVEAYAGSKKHSDIVDKSGMQRY
jgi:hypothetical protein